MIIYAKAQDAFLMEGESLPAGSTGLRAEFRFSEEWRGLERTAVFQGSGATLWVPLENDCCDVPAPVLARPGSRLWVGVCGSRQGSDVLPTLWVDAGLVQEAAAPSGQTAGGGSSGGEDSGSSGGGSSEIPVATAAEVLAVLTAVDAEN